MSIIPLFLLIKSIPYRERPVCRYQTSNCLGAGITFTSCAVIRDTTWPQKHRGCDNRPRYRCEATPGSCV